MKETDSKPAASASDRVASLGCWDSPIEVRPLGGGLTNNNYVVAHRGEELMVRLGGDIPLHCIERSHEAKVSVAANTCGIAPEIVHQEPGALVMRFVNAKTLTDQDVAQPEMLGRIVDVVEVVHTDLATHLSGASLMFWAFQINRQYLTNLGSDLDPDQPLAAELIRLAELNDELEDLTTPVNLRFCHNDLIPGNFLDDGERLWLLDWEYAGWNTPWFDLANLASNAQLDDSRRGELVEAYFKATAGPDEMRRLSVLESASLLREALWSMTQERHSSIDFDFASYTAIQLKRLDSSYQKVWS